MPKISGFSRVMARTRVNQLLNKPVVGKPYLKLGQCHHLWSYFFQLGGILAAKHRTSLDAFGNAFLAATGPPGAVERYFTAVAEKRVGTPINESMTFYDYVSQEFSQRAHYQGDPSLFFIENGFEKLAPETAVELAWQYSDVGAAIGAIHPNMLRRMFQASNARVPEDEWKTARAAGLDIPAEQEVMSYEEIEEAENGVFMAYCEKCCPELYDVLAG